MDALLLRMRRQRPSCHRTADKRYELAPSHLVALKAERQPNTMFKSHRYYASQ